MLSGQAMQIAAWHLPVHEAIRAIVQCCANNAHVVGVQNTCRGSQCKAHWVAPSSTLR